MLQAIAAPEFWPLAGIAALAGLVRGFTGFGAAMVFVPLAALYLPPIAVIVALMIMDVGGSLMLARGAIPQAQGREVGGLFAGAVVGLPLGVLLLERADPQAFRWIVPAIVLAALAAMLSGWRYTGAPGRGATVAVGGASGLLGGFAGLAGPPVILFFLGGPERAVRIRASIITYFIATSVLGFAVFGLRGALSAEALVWAAVLAPAFLAATFAGARMFRLAGEAQYRYVAHVVIAAAALAALPAWD